MVKRIQTIDEYYDEDDDELSFYPPSNKDDDEQLVLLACLLILERFFNELQSMTPQDIVDEIDDKAKQLESELIQTARDRVDSAVWDSFMSELIEWNIPIFGYVKQDTTMYEVMDSSITALVNQLRDDIKAKAKFNIVGMSREDFDIKVNFRRAIQRLVDAVSNNLNYSKELSDRQVKNFVYGEDKLYIWQSAHLPNTCQWCLDQEKRPPRLLKDWEFDHPNGHCEKVPIDETYSDEYYLLLAEMGELKRDFAHQSDSVAINRTVRDNYDTYF